MKINLDIDKSIYNKDGVVDYYFPISIDDHRNFYLNFSSSLANFIRNKIIDNEQYSDELKILYQSIITEVNRVFLASKIYNEALVQNFTLVNTKKYPYLNCILTNQSPKNDLPFSLGQLPYGPRKSRIIYKPLRFLDDFFNKKIIRRGEFHRVNFNKDIVSTTLNPLALSKATNIDKNIFFYNFDYFFKNIIITKKVNDNFFGIVNEIINLINKEFDKEKISLKKIFKNYINNWLLELFSLIQQYYEKILNNNTDLPLNLWTQSGGNIWVRILKSAVKKRNGIVTSFDHGSIDVRNFLNSQELVEFQNIDYFVTFTSKYSKIFHQRINNNLLIEKEPPIFLSAPEKNINNIKNNRYFKTNQKYKILYASTYFPIEHVVSEGFFRDICYFDWQIRLINKLKEWGYKVIFKPHPTGPNYSKRIIEATGAIEAKGSLNENLKEADIFLLDCLATSTLNTAVCSDKSITLIDFVKQDIFPFTKESLIKRISLVKGWQDDKNRAQVNWNELKKSLTDCQSLKNEEFKNNFFNEQLIKWNEN